MGGYVNISKLYSNGVPQYTIALQNFKLFTLDKNSPLSPYPLPEFDSDQQILVKLDGNSTPISVAWKIHPDDINLATEYDTNGVELPSQPNTKTTFQQIRYLDRTFRPVSITDRYELTIGYVEDSEEDSISWQGGISKIHIEIPDGEPANANAQIDFMQGNITTLWEEDTPSAPQNFVTTALGGGQLKLDWAAPKTNGSSAITGYDIEYALGSGNFTKVSLAVVTTHTVSGLTPGVYTARIYAINSQGRGRRAVSTTVTVT